MGCAASVDHPKNNANTSEVTNVQRAKSNAAKQSALSRAGQILANNSHLAFHDCYVRTTLVSYGATSRVLTAYHKVTDRKVAVKVISKEKRNYDSLRSQVLLELACWQHVQEHPNTVRLVEVFEDEKNFHIVMDFCSGGELFDHIVKGEGGFTERQAAHAIQSMLRFLAHCHALGVVHLDIKPENIVFDTDGTKGVLKVVDFGSADFCLPSEQLNNAFGTVRYCSPEMANDRCGQKSDVWSVGVVMYHMLCGKLPFMKKDDIALLEYIKKGPAVKFSGQKWACISKAAKDCIQMLLHPNPDRRPSPLDALQLPWLQEQAPDTQISATTVSHLVAFAGESQTKRLMLGILARNLTGQDAKTLVSEFQSMDRDNNGRVDFKEMSEAIKSAAPEEVQSGSVDLDRVFKAVDIDSTGTVEVSEFLAAMLKSVSSDKRNALAHHSFRFIARDGSDVFSKDDLREALQRSDSDGMKVEDLAEEDLVREFEKMDKNGDGVISFEEFRTALVVC